MTKCTAIGLEGKVFGRLVAGKAERIKGTWKYHCRCICGNEKLVAGSALSSGLTQSCGCLAKEMRGALSPRFKHGRTGTAEYRIWQNMLRRCYDKRHKDFHNYGGRGISVCERWRHSFENFLADVGFRPAGLTLDRRNNDGNYEPANVRWATAVEQANNQRPKKAATHCGFGHEFTPENTYRRGAQRYCNECRKRLKREHYHRQKRKNAEPASSHP